MTLYTFTSPLFSLLPLSSPSSYKDSQPNSLVNKSTIFYRGLYDTQCHNVPSRQNDQDLHMAGASDPTLFGLWKLPVTAAACATAAFWADATNCCICPWHWPRSNTWNTRRTLSIHDALKANDLIPGTHQTWGHIHLLKWYSNDCRPWPWLM